MYYQHHFMHTCITCLIVSTLSNVLELLVNVCIHLTFRNICVHCLRSERLKDVLY